ncbi:putative rRNA maturation factor [Hoeflea marina]|uniref:Endoribonuclease YbeY n=1 Tax=Hoeflea marina TaxID=274592 RepID=A0A317PJI1_9HYPH|nr:rRNA maturation RNase YbeY [Hoeflea marina]PWW00170.1 putative rRNA maturation factor [Hoeflea marina]
MTRALVDFVFSVEGEGWGDDAELESLVSRVLAAAASDLRENENQPFPEEPTEVSLVFADDAFVRSVNAEWRDQDKPTNVLSFPAFPIRPGGMPGPLLGDIILARETIETESRDLAKPVEAHLVHLITHGFLHLFGYDHMEMAEAEKMESVETRILATLGLSDPYGDLEPERI